LKYGDKLPSVRELCHRFGVGRTAVRDAITTLKGKGLVTVRRGEGAFVNRYDASDLLNDLWLVNREEIREVLQVRKILEPGVAEAAAENRNATDLSELKERLNEMESADHESAWEADYRFHMAIVKATRNQVLTRLMETVSNATQNVMCEFHRSILENPRQTLEVSGQHRRIYEAIQAADGSSARRLMLEHLMFVDHVVRDRPCRQD
jgi:GntR family transcriptional regulator, transcriptional repressor for pyruvate dehydrogenase complex